MGHQGVMVNEAILGDIFVVEGTVGGSIKDMCMPCYIDHTRGAQEGGGYGLHGRSWVS